MHWILVGIFEMSISTRVLLDKFGSLHLMIHHETSGAKFILLEYKKTDKSWMVGLNRWLNGSSRKACRNLPDRTRSWQLIVAHIIIDSTMYNPDNGLLGLVQDEPLPFLALISSISFITLGSAGCACLLSGLRRSMKRSMADSPDISVLKEDTNRGVSSTNSNMSNILGLSGPPTKNQVQAVLIFFF